jgi:hypothetical protein
MKTADIRVGLLLRVISAHGLGAPVGSLATVKAVETSRAGDWLCIIEYHERREPTHGTRLYRSHLWESDLGRFEIVKPEKVGTESGKVKRRAAAGPSRVLVQLALPFPSDD